MISSPAPAICGPAAGPVPGCGHCIRLVAWPGRRLSLIRQRLNDDCAKTLEFVGLEITKEATADCYIVKLCHNG
jgi:hypothetical protein